jgi:DNA-directed RNA polymerase subunit RPC12/RpoP
LKEALTNTQTSLKYMGVFTVDDIKEFIENAPTVDLWQMRQEATENALKKAEVLYGRTQGEWLDYSEEYGYIECPFCGSATTCEDNIDELHYCWNCGTHLQKGGEAIQKSNCVTCDHFGKCEGCEKGEEE